MDEIHYFLEVLKNKKGQPIDVKMPLSPSMSNNISALIFGKRYEYHDQDRQMLDRNLEQAHESFGLISLYTLFPWIRYIPFAMKFIQINKSVEAADNIRKFFKSEINKHSKSLDPRNIRDFIDSYLVEMKSQQKQNTNTTFNDERLMSNVIDIFGAGSETVRTSILWFCVQHGCLSRYTKKSTARDIGSYRYRKRPRIFRHEMHALHACCHNGADEMEDNCAFEFNALRILCVAELLKDRRRAKNNRCCQGVRHRSQQFHGCGSHLKLLECVVDGTGRSCLKYDACRRQIYRPVSKRNRRTTAHQVANQFLAASGKQISRKTVARRLRGGGLYARRPVVCVPLTKQHRTVRLQWCREHHN
ncbi:cytochrome P450 2J3 [Trichonephila clavipes]|nr:cytochrome P450 2J3 [Trichonephila clavipes]